MKHDDVEMYEVEMKARIKRREGKRRNMKKVTLVDDSNTTLAVSDLHDRETVKLFLDELASNGTLYKTGNVYYAI